MCSVVGRIVGQELRLSRPGTGASLAAAFTAVLILTGCASPVWNPGQRLQKKSSDTVLEPSGGWTPFQLGLVADLQVFPRNHDVYGFRFNILGGTNRSVYGIDTAGLMTLVDGDAGAIQVTPFGNFVQGSCFGIQAGGIAGNRVGRIKGSHMHADDVMSGLQVGGIANFGNINGIQAAAFMNGLHVITEKDARSTKTGAIQQNMMVGIARALSLLSKGASRHRSPGYVNGFQVAGLANTATHIRGCQVGTFWNGTDTGSGFQCSLVNTAEDFSGLQLGLVNINKNGWLPFFPVLNVNF